MNPRTTKQQEEQMTEWKKTYPIYFTDEGVWMHGEALVVPVPETVRQKLLETYHDAPTAGHPGIWKTQVNLGT
jgi:hypothetical protein